MAKVHRPGIWYRDVTRAALCYFSPGFYEENELPEPALVVPDSSLPALVEALDELGIIRPRLDERLRAEDLRITHRVLDLLGKALDLPAGGVVLSTLEEREA